MVTSERVREGRQVEVPEARPAHGTGTQAHGPAALIALPVLSLTPLKTKILPNGSMKGFETDITSTAQVHLKD